MSALKIYTTETKVEDLNLTANVLNSINSEPAMTEIDNKFTNMQETLSQV